MSVLSLTIEFALHFFIHTNTYKYTPDTFCNTYSNKGLKVQFNTYCISIHVNTCQYKPKYLLILILGAKTSVLNQNLIHAIHAKYMPIHANT